MLILMVNLFSELKVLKEIFKIETCTPIETLNNIKRLNYFLNVSIVYKKIFKINVIFNLYKEIF